MGRWTLVMVAAFGVGCVESRLVDCGNGLLCPVGSICAGGGCASIGDCGNGLLDPFEACDDGNRISGDGCDSTCTSDESCGNGIADFGEACDCGDAEHPGASGCAGTINGGERCRIDCALPACGNGMVDGLEACDDGNTTNGDGCAATCASNETCGNGVIDFAVGEQCDDGNLADHDGCQHTCVVQRCGDGVVDPGEVCDDGNLASGDGCAPDCASDETCGNGIIDFFAGERCDDGNRRSHDGCHSRCVIESPSWIQVGPEPLLTTPSTIAYDSQRERVVLYLGSDSPVEVSETYELLDSGWTRANPIASPPFRLMASVVYDAARGETVMFGGIDAAGYTAETWTYNGSTWTIREPQLSPSSRAGVGLAYDPIRERVVLVAGTDELGYQGDTWEWDGVEWTRTVPEIAAFRREAEGAMTYDLANRRVVLLLNGALYQYNGDSWTTLDTIATVAASMITFDVARDRLVATGSGGTFELIGTTWNPINVGSSPPGRSRAGIAYDARRREVVIHGGQNRSDTWRHDGTAWTQLTPSVRPPALYGMGVAYDNVRDRVVVFGGDYTEMSGISSETWEYDGAVWAKRLPVDSPVGVYAGYMTYDVRRQKTVLFGGRDASYNYRGETWEWDGVNWSPVTTQDAPSARYLGAITYDPDTSRCILNGGLGTGGVRADAWAYDGTNWTAIDTGAMPGHYDQAMAYDEAGDRTIVFGGYTNGPVGDTWSYDGTSWTQLGQPVSLLDYPAAAYLAARKRVVRMGGYFNVFAHELDGQAWRISARMPTDREEHRMVGDPLRDRVILFGGYAETGEPYSPDDLYAYTYRAEVPDEYCAGGGDRDGDGLAGCDDPDCAAACSPMCPPLSTCPVDAVRCGDGMCGPQESKRLCPADCGAVTPLCGDGWCDAPETVATCDADC